MNPLVVVRRKIFTDVSTVGELTFGDFRCFTLEDTCRENGVKVPGKTAIPCGVYGLIINESARFKKRMPLLLNVPGFEGVRIHCGNTAEATEGCLLIARRHDKADEVEDSRAAFDALFPLLDAALVLGPLRIEIIGGRERPHVAVA